MRKRVRLVRIDGRARRRAWRAEVAIDWARRFYRLEDLDVLAVEFETQPTRFWRVTFLASDHGQTVHLYAVVLPDGRPVEPTVREAL